MKRTDIFPRVMIVTNSISGGGAEISMARLVDALSTLGVNTTLCAINRDEINTSLQLDISVIGRKWGSGFKGTLHSLYKFRRHVLLENPNLVVVNCELPELYLALSAPWRVHVIAVEHTSRPWEGRRFLGFFVRTILLLRRTKWVTVSRDQQRVWPYSLSPIFIPNSHFQSDNKGEISGADLIFVGRLNHGKHPEIAAEAAERTSTSIDFFGVGPEMSNLQLCYDTPDIRFRGFIENPWSSISSDSIVVVPSEFEGDGMTVVEALANDNPILLSDNKDLRRFDLPNSNYFSDLDELVSKINEAKEFGIEKFRIQDSQKEVILSERKPITVAHQWILLFNEMNK